MYKVRYYIMQYKAFAVYNSNLFMYKKFSAKTELSR